MRTYSFLAGRPGGFMNWPGQIATSRLRIRQVAHIIFRSWFGRASDDLCWHKDGFMAECHDRRGNYIQVEQQNWNGPLLPVRTGICICGRSPIVGLSLCPACHQEAT